MLVNINSSWSKAKTQKILDYIRDNPVFADAMGTPIDSQTILYVLGDHLDKPRLGQLQITDNVSVQREQNINVLSLEIRVIYLDGSDHNACYIPLRKLKEIRKQRETCSDTYITVYNLLVIPQNQQQFEWLKNNHLESVMMQKLTQDTDNDVL